MDIPQTLIWLFATSWLVGLMQARAGKADFRFLSPMRIYQRVERGSSLDFNCTTNDPNATTSIWMSENGATWKLRPLELNKLVRKGDVFTLLNADHRDTYMFRCQAINAAGVTIVTPTTAHGSYLFVLPPKEPVYSFAPEQPQFRQVGEAARLTLTSTEAIPKISWKKMIETDEPGDYYKRIFLPVTAKHNITEVKTDDKITSTLLLYNLSVEDGGVYSAIGQFKDDPLHYQYYRLLVFAPTTPRIYEISPNSIVNETQEIELKCNAYAYPPADVVWFKDGKKLRLCAPHVRRCMFEVFKKSNWTVSWLTIRNVKYQDGGTYLCRTTNPNGESYSTTKVYVKSKPVMSNTKKVESIMKRYGLETKLKCKVSRGYPKPTFEWFYQIWPCNEDGRDVTCKPRADQWRALPNTIKAEPPPNEPSTLSRITLPADEPPSMAAFYKCKAKNELGDDSIIYRFRRYKTGRLNILGIEQGQSKSLNAGDTLVLQCFIRLGYISTQSLRWYKEGVEVDFSNDSRISTNLLSKLNSSSVLGQVDQAELTVTISNLTVNDSGLYTCKASKDKTQSIKVTVRATTPPKLAWEDEGTRKLTVFENSTNTVELRCKLTGGNPKPTFTWFKDGKPIFPNENQLTTPNCKHAKNGIYFFTAASQQDVVLCGDPLHFEDYAGVYTCRAENTKGKDEIHSTLTILAAAEIKEPSEENKPVYVSLDDSFHETCLARGYPPPVVEWRKILGKKSVLVSSSKNGRVELEIPLVREEDLGNYSCTARNSHSTQQHFVVLRRDPGTMAVARGKEGSTSSLFGPIAGCVAAVLFIAIITLLVWRKQKRKMKKYYLSLELHHYEIDPDKSILDQVNDMPYDPDWEFREDRLLMSTVIGSGTFGQVVKAEAMGILAFSARDKTDQAFKRRKKLRRSIKSRQIEQKPESWKYAKTTVAVKMLKENGGENEYRDLASEIKIMIHIGEHPNIINILGACTQSKRLMLIMEYAPHGSLLKFLRERREIYQPVWKKTVNDPTQEFTLVDVLMAAYQIARGMEFLASKKCIHRDLAARNVLIGEDYVMKIADFGLARDVYKNDEYVKESSGLLPVKWMALESLFDRVYTEKSDVWSFGVVLWEIFTLGGTPYPGLPTEHLLDFLSEGKRMGQPHNCPAKVYNIMKDCWIMQPECRPSFALLAELLGKFLEKNVRKDNPYIVFSLEESATGNNYHLCSGDGDRTSTHNSSTAYLEAGSTSFEPIESPEIQRKGANERYSPLPVRRSEAPDETPRAIIVESCPHEPDLPPSYDEALKLSNQGIKHLPQLVTDEEKKMADIDVWLDDCKDSAASSSADEGIDVSSGISERKRLLSGSTDDNENKVNNSDKENPEIVVLTPTKQSVSPRRARCESVV